MKALSIRTILILVVRRRQCHRRRNPKALRLRTTASNRGDPCVLMGAPDKRWPGTSAAAQISHAATQRVSLLDRRDENGNEVADQHCGRDGGPERHDAVPDALRP